VVVPITVVSSKEEYAAATIRKKIQRQLDTFLVPLNNRRPKRDSLDVRLNGLSVENPTDVVSSLSIDRSVAETPYFAGGTSNAKKRLTNFIKKKLDRFGDLRNDPSRDYLSNLSPYLHFGQISPLYIALAVRDTKCAGSEAFIEELIVRRELSMNFVWYNQSYGSFDCLPQWARDTLMYHKRDEREYMYTTDEFEQAQTHDPYWNAAQMEMVATGKMHGYMRMYWGKKIIEWSKNPQEAFITALSLNNKYELDGRDPNGFAGVAWCFGKHDRAWAERPIFGKVRYMNANGLKRKFNIDAYVDTIKRISDRKSQE
jgi:deoxyribodipyrimidine photo-lyase